MISSKPVDETRRLRRRNAKAMVASLLINAVFPALAQHTTSIPDSNYTTASSGIAVRNWWQPGSGEVLPARGEYLNERGHLAVLNALGPVNTKGHPFFEPLGSNGRACVTCHQPGDGMSISAQTARERWNATQGNDPLFAAIDGSNCPNLPQQEQASHSLLLNKGLFRISLPWPARDAAGKPIEPEFSIEVVNDPTGCNTSSQYGLHSAEPHVNVYRRPRMVANMKYVESTQPLGLWQVRSGEPLPKDPDTGARLAGNLMADSRAPTLRAQMRDAIATHLQAHQVVSSETEDRIRAFELQIYAAQVSDILGGSLQQGGANLGPDELLNGRTAVLGSFPHEPTLPELEGWRTQSTLKYMTWPPLFKQRALPVARINEDSETPQERAFRDSVARGYDLFLYRQFLIRNVGSLNPLLGNPVKQTCADCHNMQRTGMDNAPGYLELGTHNYPTATPSPDLPLFKITCRQDRPPHPYLGRLVYTTDPGRALISGKCADIGAATAQQMRALAARAPYFSNGSAKNLREVIEFYDRRFNIGYSEREINDLVNFLGVL